MTLRPSGGCPFQLLIGVSMLRKSLQVEFSIRPTVRMMRLLFVWACFAGLVALSARRADAQATGQIAGVVSDPSGSVVLKASVELVSTTTSQARSAMTGADGAYAFPLVNPGVYQVKVSLTGFRTSVTKGVEVLVNGTTRVDVKLSVGSTNEQVTVTDAAPLVETSNATLGNVVEHASIVDLPLNGRSFAQLGTLIPG